MSLTPLLSQSATPAGTPAVRDISVREFVTEVIKASAEVPVLVDFWAPWCGPCKQLGPVLEKVVAATRGAVRLVKMDIDRNPQIAAQLGVQSIPAVFAFYKGQPVDGFMGVQPESSIRAFVDRLVRLAGTTGKGAAGEVAAALEQAAELLAKGDIEGANSLYDSVLAADPANAAAYAGLIRVALAVGNPAEAQAMLDEAPPEIAGSKELDGIRAQLALVRQAEQAGPVDALEQALAADPGNHARRYDLALALHAAGRSGEAIDHLIEIIRRERSWNEDAARQKLVTIFEALGLMHELTVAGRRKLSAVLFK